MPKGLFLWQSEAGKYFKFRGPLNLSDEEVEFQVNECRSFEEFVGLGVMNGMPDATTVAFFRERLCKAGVIEERFEMYEGYPRDQGLEARGGQIIDATLVSVSKQRNTRKKQRYHGQSPTGWIERKPKSVAK